MNLKILSGSALKVLAVTAMLVDHTALYFLQECGRMNAPLFTLDGFAVSPYVIMRAFGRLAFPLFAFLITEGFIHTSNRRRYAVNLGAFALLSEVPWFFLHLKFPETATLNVMFTLLLGYLGIWAIEENKDNPKKMVLFLAGTTAAALFAHADFGSAGYAFILMLYLLRDRRIPQAAIGCCMLRGKWLAGLAFIPINMYDGRRGFIKGKFGKYLFYSIYPIHLGLILLILLLRQ